MREDPAQRSRTMRAVKSRDTAPEMAVRRMAHAMGYRFRLHRRDLPGTPDLVFPAKRVALFVNGCFWHGHNCRRGRRKPKANAAYWRRKIERNRERDRRNAAALRRNEWRVGVVWECQVRNTAALRRRLGRLAGADGVWQLRRER